MLAFPDQPGLRPTPDRVRQTLFNWLGQDLAGLVCLDLFSGTGVMGFEALSRGAEKVIMVEKSTVAYKALQQNKQLLNAAHAHLINMDAMQFLAENASPFDVIFLDPPYKQGWLAKLLPAIKTHLKLDGVIYAEAEFAMQDDDDWQVVKHGKAGNVFYHLLKSRHERT